MPHSLFLGSALATQNRLSPTPLKDESLPDLSPGSLPEERRPTGILNHIKRSFNEALQVKAVDDHKNRPQRHQDRENNSYWFVKSHVYHGVVDIVLSLLGIAVVINSMWVAAKKFNLCTAVHDVLLISGFSSWRALCFTMGKGGTAQILRTPRACLTPTIC
jgi:hypothetical protein